MKSFYRRRRTVSVLSTLAVVALGAAALEHNGKVVAASAMQPAITITHYAFKPGTITVREGSTVTWINRDDDVHTIKGTAGPEKFSSPAMESGSRFGFTFDHAGTYRYICTVHPYMHGVVIVRPAIMKISPSR